MESASSSTLVDFEKLARLGAGSFGEVFKVRADGRCNIVEVFEEKRRSACSCQCTCLCGIRACYRRGCISLAGRTMSSWHHVVAFLPPPRLRCRTARGAPMTLHSLVLFVVSVGSVGAGGQERGADGALRCERAIRECPRVCFLM